MNETLTDSARTGSVGLSGVVYASGNLGKSALWSAFDTVLIYYLVVVAGFEPLPVGMVLALAMLLDGACDVFVSWLVEGNGDLGLMRRMLWIGAPVTALSLAAVFLASPAGLSSVALIGALLCACRVGYSICDVAHNALLIGFASPPSRAMSVSALRVLFSSLGAAGVGAGFQIASDGRGVTGMGTAMPMLGVLVALVYLVTVPATSFMHAPHNREAFRDAGEVAFSRFSDAARHLLGDPGYRNLCCLIAAQAGLVGLLVKGLPFHSAVAFNQVGWAGEALVFATIGQALASISLMSARRWRPSQAAILIGAHMMMVAALLLYASIAAPTGWLPIAIMLLVGIAQGAMNSAIWARLAEVVLRISPMRVLPIGIFLGVLKASSGLANLALALALALVSDEPAAARHITLVTVVAIPIVGSIMSLALVRRNTT